LLDQLVTKVEQAFREVFRSYVKQGDRFPGYSELERSVVDCAKQFIAEKLLFPF
jgi:hypothetical protein